MVQWGSCSGVCSSGGGGGGGGGSGVKEKEEIKASDASLD